MLVQTKSRKDFLHAAMNTWLKDTRIYCNNCGKTAEAGETKCCEDPQIGTNYDICKAVVEQNKMLRQTRLNEFASTKGKHMRFGVSLPPGLYQCLDRLCKKHENKGLFNEEYDVNWFAKNFRVFAIPEKI